MADVNDIEEALKAVQETSEEESSPDEASEEEKEETSPKASKKGANSRIQELVADKKRLEEEFEKTKSTLSERDAELGKLVDLLKDRDNAAQVLDRINELYQEETHKPFIEYLDKLVRGEEVKTMPTFSELEREPKDESLQKGLEVLSQLDEKKAEIYDAIAEERDNMILEKADQLADAWLAELPKEYSDEDKKILSEAVVQRIDWDAVQEAEGKNLREEATKGFQATLDWYGKPKGMTTESKEDKETIKEETPEDISNKLKKLVDQDWAKMKESETSGGKKLFTPVISDAEFQKITAEAMRQANKLGS